MKKIWRRVNKDVLVILFIAFILFGSNLFSGYFRGSDTTFHLSHLLSYIKTFSFHDLFGGSILPDVANNFGYGTRLFYQPLGYNVILIIFSIVKNFGLGIVFSTKFAYLISMMLSGIFMYYFTLKAFKNKFGALLSAVLYMSMPYHILDIFFRDALSEIFFFAFVPLVLLGIEYLFEKNYKKFYLCFISGYVLSILSHLALTIYLTFFVLIYLILNYKKILNKDIIVRLIGSGVLMLAFVSPFIIPMLEHMFFGNYMVFEYGFMFTKDSVAETALSLGDMLKMPIPNGELFFTFSYIALIAFIVVIVCGYKNIDNKRVFKHFTILLFICLIMLTPLFPWSKLPSILLNIQFVWRLEIFFGFFISVLASLIVYLVNKKNQKVLVTALSCISIIFAVCLINFHDYTDIDLEGVKEAGIGETWGLEYLPVNTYYHRDYLLGRNDDIIVKKGKADISNVINETPYLEFDVKADKKVTLEIPRLYYLGYKITLDGNKINYYENDNGFIELNINKSGKIKVVYEGTTGYKVAIALFVVALGIVIIYIVWSISKRENMK